MITQQALLIVVIDHLNAYALLGTRLQVQFVSYESVEKKGVWRQRGRVARAPDLKSGNPKFKSCSHRQLDLLHVVPGLTLRVCLYIAYKSAFYQLEFLTCLVHLLYFRPTM